MYAPQLGRFISRDPAGYTDGPSLYEGMEGAPTDNLDPSGLRSNTDQFGQYWDPNVDWLHFPTRKPNGFIPGMGFPPGDPNYNTRPNLEAEVAATCTPPVRGCSECQATFNRRVADLLRDLGASPLGAGFAGAGKGILTGIGIKGGTIILSRVASGSAFGPIGTIGGAVVGLAGTASGVLDYNTKYTAYKLRSDEINRAYQDCMSNCNPMK